MEKNFSKLKAEADRIVLPDECEENDRAVRYLALETGVGHYDNLNLLIMAVLFIFVSVAFLAVNGGRINNDDDEFAFSMETLMSGEFTKTIEEKYISELPIPDELKRAGEYVSLLYGFGNKLSEKESGNYSTASSEPLPDSDHNAFDRDDDDDQGLSENAVTTRAVKTDKDGNTVTEPDSVETAPGGGTTAVSRPPLTASTTSVSEEDDDEETTTTNNEAPSVTTTTTTTGTSATTESTTETSETSETSESDTETSEPDTDTSEPDTSGPDTETTEVPAETGPVTDAAPDTDTEPEQPENSEGAAE